ncbi:MAG: hypothetical protein WAP08_04870 [Smithellaceae bacterium]|jgi:hypothetical protein|nr:hypothetical protein [Syntrophaceae bacterium]
MYDNLTFRRQFLLAKEKIKFFDNWNSLQIGSQYLYTHPDLDTIMFQDLEKLIVLMGNIYNPKQPDATNHDILEIIHKNSNSITNLFCQVKRFAGAYAIIYKNSTDYIIFHDALGIREIYYCTSENLIICGSQPNLIADFSEPPIRVTDDPLFLDFFNNHLKNSSMISDNTYFKDVKHLLPNHYLDLNQGKASRYWPSAHIKKIDLDDAVQRICNYLQGIMNALVQRHQIMMAITAGIDSRTLLAASKYVKDKIYFFVNDENIGHNHPDIYIPCKIFRTIGEPFHVHDNSGNIDLEFRKIFLNNVFLASERMLPTIYNVYFKNHSNKVNILGTGEIGRTRFGKDPRWINGHYLAYKMKHHKSPYAVKQCEKILSELTPIAKMAGLNIMTIFQWEQNKGNRWVVGNSESDIAIEEIDPFDSHLLYEYFLGVDDMYTDYENPIIFKKIIHNMWPELLTWPVNPPYTIKDKMKNILKMLGIFKPLDRMKYGFSYFYWRYMK